LIRCVGDGGDDDSDGSAPSVNCRWGRDDKKKKGPALAFIRRRTLLFREVNAEERGLQSLRARSFPPARARPP